MQKKSISVVKKQFSGNVSWEGLRKILKLKRFLLIVATGLSVK